PCAIVLAIEQPTSRSSGRKQVQVAGPPMTHSNPHDASAAIEIPRRVKNYLGLDSQRSWGIVAISGARGTGPSTPGLPGQLISSQRGAAVFPRVLDHSGVL